MASSAQEIEELRQKIASLQVVWRLRAACGLPWCPLIA
jgi:hypothetical protein